MKTVKYLSAFLASVFLIVACQKELSVESGLTGGLATGTLRDTLGECQPVSVNGKYNVARAVNDSNFVYVRFNVASPGVYRISTDQQNGFSFRDSGYFSTAGPVDVKLRAVGTPILPISTGFTVSFGTSNCRFAVKVDTARTGGGGGANAVFTFGNTAGVCTTPVVQGTCTAGTPLTAANTVTLNVIVTTPGTYLVSTQTTNGITFTGLGTFNTAGPATLRLTGSGTPTAAAITGFIVTNGSTSGCGFPINITSSGGGANATYNLETGPSGNCINGTVQGTYTTGIALTMANTITVSANVISIGAYNISSQNVNGITFSKVGTFTATGVQPIILQGSGTPTTAGVTTVPVIGGTSGCGLQITVAQGSGGGGGGTTADSAWSFNQATRFFHGPVDTAYVDTIPGFGTFLSIEGSTFVTGDTSVFIDIFLAGGSIAPGSYSTATGASFNFSTSTVDIYDASPTIAGSTMNIVIISYNSTTRLVIGTYSGTARNTAGVSVPIINGKFRATVR